MVVQWLALGFMRSRSAQGRLFAPVICIAHTSELDASPLNNGGVGEQGRQACRHGCGSYRALVVDVTQGGVGFLEKAIQ
jgi:hypothetical protein